MAHGIAALSSERHYMGSFTSGSYATDRNARPDYDVRPSAETLARWEANEPANRTRYLRENDALGLVIDCHEAKEELALIEARLGCLRKELERESCTGRELSALRETITLLETRRAQVLANRQDLSSQLRALGISPKQEAQIWCEFVRRETIAS